MDLEKEKRVELIEGSSVEIIKKMSVGKQDLSWKIQFTIYTNIVIEKDTEWFSGRNRRTSTRFILWKRVDEEFKIFE